MNSILEVIIYVFSGIGMAGTAIILYKLLKLLTDNIIDNLLSVSSKKMTTTECYCIDCVYHGINNHRCYKHTLLYTRDMNFCHDAKPRTFINEKENKDD